MTRITIQEIDKLLPQTQCGLCGYPGCMPYAQALANHHANINLCLPGGVETLNKLGLLLSIDPQPYLAEMEKKAKPKSTVLIQEEACIGCTKCIQVCPVDAIIGSSKSMHTVIQNECTGCDLCIPACPVDCIEVLPNTSKTPAETRESQIAKARNRFHSRQLRLENKKTEDVVQRSSTEDKKNYIEQALARIKSKKNQSL